MLKTIKDVDFTGKRVLMRVDLNIALDDKGDALDQYKLQAPKESIDHILSFEGVRLALMSHRGRPDGQRTKDLSLMYLADDLARAYGRTVLPVCECVGVCVVDTIEKATQGEIVLLENLRFHIEEEDNDDLFAQQLAAPFDVYVNDAFAVTHRAHASVSAIVQHIPSYAGFWLAREVEQLSKVKDATEHPAVAIIGGAKVATKIPLIDMFEKSYDTILVGGLTAVEAQDEDMTFSDKVLLPSDYAQDQRDIGPQTITAFTEIIRSAKTIVWNGPMGKFEEKPYDAGTRAVTEAIVDNSAAFSVIGGGESVQALTESGHADDVSFVSTGGGAMLSFLSGEDMPGLDALEKK